MRLWKLGEQSLWIDEGFTLNAVRSIGERGVPLLDSGRFYGNGVANTYLVALSEKIFGSDPFNPWSARLPAALFGTALVIAVYILAKELTGDEILSLSAAFVIAFSTWEIAWSRQARGYALASLLIVAAFVFLSRSLRSGRFVDKAFFVMSLFLACFSQESALALVPALIVVGMGIRNPFRAAFVAMALCFVVYAIVPGAPLRWIPQYIHALPMELLIALCGSICAAIVCLFKIGEVNKRNTISFLLVPAGIATAVIVLFSPAPQVRYLFPLYPLFVVATLLFVRMVTDTVFVQNSKKVRSILFVVIILAPALSFLDVVPRSIRFLERGSPQPDFKTVYSMIKNDRTERDVVISGFSQLHKVYLEEKGLWLKMNFNGDPLRVEDKVINGRDFYVGASIVSSVHELQGIIAKRHGFIIVDSMTDRQIPELFPMLEENPLVKRIYSDLGEKNGAPIYLYRF